MTSYVKCINSQVYNNNSNIKVINTPNYLTNYVNKNNFVINFINFYQLKPSSCIVIYEGD